MTAWEVMDSLSLLTQWEESEKDNIFTLCKASLKEIEAMLKKDADRSDIRIAVAAAANAYYKLSLRLSFSTPTEEITNFKAGDVSITQGTSDNSQKQLDRAEKLYAQALHNIIPLCQDNGFAFENIVIRVKP